MAGYLEWVAITAVVVAVAALAAGLAEMRKRRQRQAAVRAGYEAWQGLAERRVDPELAACNQKWEREIKKHEADQDSTISQWSAGLREAVYQPISESDLAHRFQRP